MSKPKKKRGFRPIKVRNIAFYWCFSGIIDIRPENHKNNILTIDFGWYDAFAYANDWENMPPEFNPKIMTPKFVSASIKFALDNGWVTELSNNRLNILYRDGAYLVKE